MSHAGSVANSSSKRHGQSGGCATPSHRNEREASNDVSQHSLPSYGHHHHHHHHFDPEWEAKEELRLRELEEARARAAQMEKTMRWWSDCTANWREKWSKVRTERNKAREEARVLRGKLEAASKESALLKREKQELDAEIEKLRKEVQYLRLSDEKKEDKASVGLLPGERLAAERDICPEEKPTSDRTSPLKLNSLLKSWDQTQNSDSNNGNQVSNQDLEFLDKLLQQDSKDVSSVASDNQSTISETKDKNKLSQKTVDEYTSPVQELTEQKVAMLQLKLDEAAKTIVAERQEKNKLMKGMEKLHIELNQLKMKYDDLRKSRQDTLKELNQIKAEHQDEIDCIRIDLEDEANNRTSLDQRLAELRAELERLQAENAAEWGRRERLETEKLNLERENKKLRTQIEDLEERLERKTKQMTSASDSDVKALQMEIHEKNKELADLKHAHTKLKKVLQEKSTELSHALRRSEQYEGEVKKLRGRIEELKKELAAAEDEVDSATNNIRKLQRSNDELQEQVEGLQVQVEHLQSRLGAEAFSDPVESDTIDVADQTEEHGNTQAVEPPCDKPTTDG